MEDVKWLLKKLGISDFDVANCGNNRSDLLGKATHGRTEGGRRNMGASGGNRGQ